MEPKRVNKKADMTANDMYAVIAKRTGTSANIVRHILREYAESIKSGVARDGGCVLLPGLGKFVKTYRNGFTGKNPKTGEPVEIPASANVRFIPLSALKNIANASA